MPIIPEQPTNRRPVTLTAIASRATTTLVALIAGYASYRHIAQVATEAGEHPSVAVVLPFAIDGAILVGTLAILEDKRSGRKPRLSARIAIAFGVIATLAANIASAQPTWTARAVAAVPPLAFLISIEVLSRRGKLIQPEPITLVEPVTVEPEPIREPVTAEPEPAVEPNREPTREPELATAEPKVEPKPKRLTPHSTTSAERVMEAHLAEPDATNQRIAELAGVSLATVKRYRPKREVSGSTNTSHAANLEAVVA